MSVATITVPLLATSAVELHKQADFLREDGQTVKAINTYNEAIMLYIQDKDYSQLLGALTGRLLSWKHRFMETNDRNFAIFVKTEAETMLEIAKENQVLDRMHLLHYLKGTAAALLDDYETAEFEFRKALELYPNSNSPEIGDWTAQLGEPVYKNCKKEEGKELILQGVEIIKERSDELDPFLQHVWVSGAYLRLAKLLRSDDLAESTLYLNKAKEIIESDDKLVIRKRQLEAYLKQCAQTSQ